MALGALALLLSLFAFASTALAGPPVHPALPALDLVGAAPDPGPTHPVQPFNHACGTAVDSEGDVYVASAGNGVIDVFNPAHEYLTSIPNANGPCGLAVDSTGRLYVSQQKSGEVKVVRYTPNAYPFAGTPTYGGAPTTIDSSGNAKGISVDPFDGRLYVAEGSRISTYDSEGNLGTDEVQRVLVFEATGGTFKLSFEGQETGSLPWNAIHAEVQAALEALSTIGAGNVAVTQGPNSSRDHLVTFEGTLGHTDVPPITANTSGLTGGTNLLLIFEFTKGFNGHIGEGDLTDATGVAAYTYKVTNETSDRYLFAADAATDQVKVFSGPDIRTLKLRKTINGPKPGEDFGFGTEGAYLTVDPGNGNPTTQKCENPVDEQACTAGHLLVYDEAHKAVDEFEADGEFLDQFTDPAFADAKPTALAVDRSGGANDGTLYVTAGAGAGAKLLAFEHLAPPSRPPLPELSRVLETARAVATDSSGNVYVAARGAIHVFGPDGSELTEFETPRAANDLAVDSTGKVYMRFGNLGDDPADQEVVYYTPSSYPLQPGTTYTGPELVATGNDFLNPTWVTAIGINPASDHLFVGGYNDDIIELDSAAPGHESQILDPCFACALPLSVDNIAAYGANGNVYVSDVSGSGTLFVIDPTGTEVIARINGAGSPSGPFGGPPGTIAVDQSNGHVLVFNGARGVAKEYDASGAFVTEFGKFTSLPSPAGIAIDNSGGPADGNVYVAFDDTAPGTFDLTAFGPLTYGERPVAVTGIADGLGAGDATLHGTVDPRGFDLTECRFEYLTDAQYLTNGKTFAGATSVPCAESLAEIGKGTGPVSVHADISSLDPEARYRFRLVAENKYGPSKEGKAGLFGPPVLTTKTALPILYDEATLRAEVDPSGLATKYRFEYGTSETYGQSTPVAELAPGDGFVAVEVPLTGLTEGTEYHFHIVAENEAKTVPGPDQTFATLERLKSPPCPNAEYRAGLSANLPDCRAYELVTPAETRGATPRATTSGTAGQTFNNWLVTPRGEGAGESIAYFTSTTLPGFEGTGEEDGYHAQRAPGLHPAAGWSNELLSPSYAQNGGESAHQHGIAADQRYGFFSVSGQGALERGKYLRTPSGLEPIGKGSLGTDLEAEGRFLSPGGAHVVFFSEEHLEPDAAPEGTVSVYDRVAGASTARVVSLKPGGAAFGAGEDAAYVGATEDGSAVLFKVGGALYLHREGDSVEIAAAPNAFAGIADDGKRVFYANASFGSNNAQPADLFACDVEAGPCAGPGAHAPTEIAPESVFVNVSPDGSHVLFSSEEALTGAEENEAGETAEATKPNLYAWDDAATRFLAVLHPQDFESFGGNGLMNLSRWAPSVSAGVGIGRGDSPTRSTPDGEVFAFQSHARLTPYDNGGHGEIYRYEPAAAPGERLLCVSCDPTGAPASADAQLLVDSGTAGVTESSTLVPNLTDDGGAVFFQSPDRLLPEDANEAEDVYGWKAPGAGGCQRPGGCLALISSGQGEEPSYLYGMSADGSDVFFETPEKLVGADIPGSPSLYDARTDGGIPDPVTKAPCQGDACQGQGSPAPSRPVVRSDVPSSGNPEHRPLRPCPKGKRKVRHKGKTRCVAKHQRHHHRRANHKRGGKR